jgi:hypothetical protein
VQGVATITGSTTAASAIARGANLTSTLVAAANNDVLVGLDVNPTFTNGAFTGVTNLAARFIGSRGIIQIESTTNSQNSSVRLSARTSNSTIVSAGFYQIPSGTNNSYFTIAADDLNPQLSVFRNGNVLIQNGGTITDAGFRLDVNGTARVQGALTLNVPSATNTRETLFRGSVSDDNQSAFYINNGTSSNSIFAPAFAGFCNNSNLFSLGFAGFTNTANDAADSNLNVGLLDFLAVKTTNATDPYNGTLSDPTNRRLFTFRNVSNIFATIFVTGNLGLNTTTDIASAQLHVSSTTKGFLPPRMTTTQKNAIASPATGLVVYDNTLNKLSVFTGATWETVTSL